MAVKIRLRRQGRRNSPFYRLVVADSRSPRDGKYIESIGTYNPLVAEGDLHLTIKKDKLEYWLGCGAILSDNVESIVAKGAPEILKAHLAKAIEKKVKTAAKRRARNKKKSAAKA